jgi:zinc transport system permease protein
MEYLLLVLVALTVVVLIRVVGIILVIALLTAPAATAALITNNLKKRMVYAIMLGMFYCITGLFISYEIDIASGAIIVILSVISYFISYIINSIVMALKKSKLTVTA